jgi:NitT/TauT family transport system substrate-binding protein
VIDKDGLAKAQEIMVKGGVLPADKIVPYEKLVSTEYAVKAQAKYAKQ